MGVEYSLNFAQVGTPLSFPDNQGNSWTSTGESLTMKCKPLTSKS